MKQRDYKKTHTFNGYTIERNDSEIRGCGNRWKLKGLFGSILLWGTLSKAKRYLESKPPKGF